MYGVIYGGEYAGGRVTHEADGQVIQVANGRATIHARVTDEVTPLPHLYIWQALYFTPLLKPPRDVRS